MGRRLAARDENGLKPENVQALTEGRRPTGMADDEEIIYDFCTELFKHQMRTACLLSPISERPALLGDLHHKLLNVDAECGLHLRWCHRGLTHASPRRIKNGVGDGSRGRPARHLTSSSRWNLRTIQKDDFYPRRHVR